MGRPPPVSAALLTCVTLPSPYRVPTHREATVRRGSHSPPVFSPGWAWPHVRSLVLDQLGVATPVVAGPRSQVPSRPKAEWTRVVHRAARPVQGFAGLWETRLCPPGRVRSAAREHGQVNLSPR